jgi:hypothetical protein
MKSKLFKAQFNDLCLGGMLLDNTRVSVYAGEMGLNCIEVTSQGINIQAASGSIVLNSTNLRGPGFTYNSTLADFVPFIHSFLPRKNIGPILELTQSFSAVSGIAAAIGIGVA